MPVTNNEERKILVTKEALFESVITKVDEVLKTDQGKREKLSAICKLLKENISYYDWVEFCLVNPKKRNELMLGPYIGEPTEHVKIPFGKRGERVL